MMDPPEARMIGTGPNIMTVGAMAIANFIFWLKERSCIYSNVWIFCLACATESSSPDQGLQVQARPPHHNLYQPRTDSRSRQSW